MRLTIIPSDGSIYVDGRGYTNLDLTWIPEIDGKKVHAVQWEDGQGEVEFVGHDQNLKIIDLGVFKQAIDIWSERKEEEESLIRQKLELEEKHRKEEEERLRSQFIDIDDEYAIDVDALDEYGFSEKPYIPPTENHIPPIDPILNEEEDEDLFYDIEELLKEI
jgi:hypothetical protein